MLEDAAGPLLLTQAALLERIARHPARVVRLDADWPHIAPHPTTAPVNLARPQNPAYVIYTSGSTGKPKGVTVAHQNVVNLMSATIHWRKLLNDEVWTLFHSFAFDFSVWEIWGALLHGGRLVVVRYSILRSP